MKIPTVLEEPKAYFLLLLAHRARRHGDFESSRRNLGKILRAERDDWSFLIAYDASLMMLEGRFEDSIHRFEEGWRLYSRFSDPNSKYLTAYCRCFISCYAGDVLENDLIENATSLDADPIIKTLFKFPKANPLPEFFQPHRGAASQR